MKNTVSYGMARTAGILNEHDEVVYDVFKLGRKTPSFVVTFHFVGDYATTAKLNCSWLWDVAVFAPDGIVAQVVREGLVARVRAGKGWQVGRSACDGSAVCVQDGTPFSCDPRFETYWCS